MEIRSRLASLAFALIAGLGLLSLAGCDSQPEDPNQFPSKLSHRVALKPASAEETIRYVDYAPDGVTKLATQIEYVNGNTAYMLYRPDGTVSDVKIVYKAKEGETEAQRQVKRILRMDLDGKTYLQDTGYREDGTLEREGKRGSESAYDIYFYFADGTATQRHQSFLRADKTRWDLVLDETWRQDRTVESVYRLNADNSSTKVAYYPNGAVLSETVTNSWNSSAKSTFYREDGKTVKEKWEQSSWYVTVQEFRADGTIAVTRRFTGTWLTVTVHGSKGNPLYSQEWNVDKTSTSTDNTVGGVHYTLRTLTYWRAENKISKRVNLAPDGTPQSVSIPQDEPWNRTEKTFRADGTLEKIEVYKDGRVVSTEKHAASENIREHVDPAHVQLKPFDAPPPTLVPRGGGFGGRPWF